MLPEGTLPGRLERRATKIPTEGTSALKVDVALRGRIELSRHTAGRRDDLDLRKPYVFRGTFDEQIAAVHAAKRNLLPDVVPYIATLSSGADPTQAPQGQDVLSIWASRLPFAPDEPWNVVGERATKQIMADVATYYDGVEEFEIGRWTETWPDLARRTFSTHGNWEHVDFTATRSGPLRPAFGFSGYKTPVPGLFLTGAGTHPGPGVSGIPGRLAAQSVQRTLKR